MELQQNLSQLNLKVNILLLLIKFFTLQQLILQLEDSIKKIERLETCDCRKTCHMNESISREDGDVWDAGCETCQCKEGIVKCYKKPCPVINCKNPVLNEGECCQKCLSEFL